MRKAIVNHENGRDTTNTWRNCRFFVVLSSIAFAGHLFS